MSTVNISRTVLNATVTLGADGRSYDGTSTTSLAIGTGSKSVTTQRRLAWRAGAKVRLASAANPAVNYMVGTVTSYSGTTLAFTVASGGAYGSGTYADWTINLSGEAGEPGATGGTGATGPGYYATSTTSLSISNSGTRSFTTQAGLAYAAGMPVRATRSDNSGFWMQGTVTSYSDTSLVVSLSANSGSGTYASWVLSLAPGLNGSTGATGATGAAGAGYGGTSTTSLAIATGAKTFTTQAGLAYVVGGRVRASSAANGANYMEGLVTSYSGTTLTLNVTLIGGSGTLADWNLAVAGEPGTSGSGGPFFSSASITKIVPGVTGEYPVINYAVPSFTAAEGDTITVQYVNGGVGTETIVMEVDTAEDGVSGGNVSLGNVSTHGDVMAAVASHLAGLTSFFSAATWNGTTLHLTGASQGDDVSISISGTGAMSGLSASDSGVTEVAETGQREVEVVAAVSGKRPLFSPASCIAQKSAGDDWTRDLQLCYKVGSTYTPITTVEAVYLTGDGAITTLGALNAAFHEGALAAPPVGASVILRTVASGTPEDDLTGTGFTLTIGGTHY